MKEYHKIQTVFLRDMTTKHKSLLIGQYSTPAFGYLANNEWVFTEKVNGTNIRVMIDAGRVTFCGKTDDSQIHNALVRVLEDHFLPQKEALLEAFPDGGCLYGEGYGAKILKGGGNYRPDQDFVLFDVKVGDWWLERANIEDVALKFGLDVVPIIGRGTLGDMVSRTREGFTSQWGDFKAEGMVARPACELKTRSGERIITKIKHRDFPSSQAKSQDHE
jgi:hypothetical protein